ncbi:MAG TPA: hypothetical protein VIH61_01025 [Waddliaceae bacterium]
MASYSGFESTAFSSDHAAWRDISHHSLSALDDISKRSMLRWTNVSTKNAVQFWRLVPAGFGAYFDIRSGQVWVIVATSIPTERTSQPDHFTHWDRYLQKFNRLRPHFSTDTHIQAIRVESGNRL